MMIMTNKPLLIVNVILTIVKSYYYNSTQPLGKVVLFTLTRMWSILKPVKQYEVIRDSHCR
ncbi:hypothetical protein BC833DRAFT_593591 [Globomyces pollinis-pini]|nr:hypothetical protein BC833DRAFT_593591 [Globomyces pollinis-pini]